MIVRVAPSIPVAKTFSYRVPDEWGPFLQPFQRVKVPFHNRTVTGFISGFEEGPETDLKEVYEIVDLFPLVEGPVLQLSHWASGHYLAPIGFVLKYVLPSVLQVERYLTVESLSNPSAHLQGLPLAKACKAYGGQTLMRFLHEGSIRLRDRITGGEFVPRAFIQTAEQTRSCEKTLFAGKLEERLEYYVPLVTAHLAAGGNVLMLLPDFRAIGKYVHRRLIRSIGKNILWYGASIKGAARMESYFRARNETGNLILGNKSCAFLPIKDLSLIIIERQEEDEFRNEEGFNYNAGVVAGERGTIEHIPVVFGSASPSVDLMKEVEEEHMTLRKGSWPRAAHYTEVGDEKGGPRKGALHAGAIDLIELSVARGEKLAVYTPRKDYGSYLRCIECEKEITCPLCESLLSYQKSREALFCAPCNKVFPYKGVCSRCGSNLVHSTRPGAEYLFEVLRMRFPDVPVLKVGSDTLGKDMIAIRQIPEGSAAIIVGTQILSKMYGFTVDTLVLTGSEELARMTGYRAQERAFHVFMNLIDALGPKEVTMITSRKKIIDAAMLLDPEQFYADELKRRRDAEFPPYVRMFMVELEKSSEQAGYRLAGQIDALVEEENLSDHVTGPLFQKREKYRWRYILKGEGEAFNRVLWRLYDMPGVRIEADPLNI
jgi:primosomal protein N' (replication factor Y) (superfamily II helicase)